METISQAVARLRDSGYPDEFSADAQGLKSATTGAVYRPETLRVDEAVRFEGQSDPGDEAVVFALVPGDGAPGGTYAVAFGPAMGALDAEIVPRLGAGLPKAPGTPIGGAPGAAA
jgi:hypothetical protein